MRGCFRTASGTRALRGRAAPDQQRGLARDLVSARRKSAVSNFSLLSTREKGLPYISMCSLISDRLPEGSAEAKMKGIQEHAGWTRALGFSAALTLSMGCGAAKSLLYTGVDREAFQQPDRVLEALALAPGMTVADVGAGGGYFTWKFAARVGPKGHVYAVDVDEDLLRLLGKRAAEGGHQNVSVVDARPGLSVLEDRVDVAFLCNSYHMIENRLEYLRTLRATLRPGGRVAVIDLKPQGFYGLYGHHGTRADIIRKEMEQSGYRLDRQFDFLEHQNFQVFVPVDAKAIQAQ